MHACSAPSAPNATRTYSLVSMTISHIGRILPRIHQVEWCHSIRYFSYIPNWMHHATPTSRTVEQSKQSIRKKILMGEYRISIWLRQTSIHKQRHVSGSNILLLFVQISSHSPWSSHWKCVFACMYVVCVCGLTNAVLHFVFFMLLLSQTNQDRSAIPILQFIQPYYIRVPKPKRGSNPLWHRHFDVIDHAAAAVAYTSSTNNHILVPHHNLFLFSSLYIWSLALIIFIILVHFGFDVTTKKKLFILFTPTTISNEYNVLYDMTDNRSRPPTRRTRARHHWWTNWKENNKKIRTCMCIYLSVHFWQDQLFRSIGLV